MPDVNELVSQAQSALAAGNRLAARGYLRRAARMAPDRLDIWRDLCQVSDRPVGRIDCLEHIVALDPADEGAKGELEALRQALEAEKEVADVQEIATPGNGEGYATGRESSAQNIVPLAEGGSAGMRADVTDEMRRQWDEAVAAGKPLFCIDHPQRETTLRCNRCGAPVCTQCVVRTPVGFRCRECIKAQQSIFFNVLWYDYPVAAFLSLLLSVPASILSGLAGWWFALIISPLVGGLIGTIVHRAVGRRRGRGLWVVVATGILLGAFVALIYAPSSLISIGIYAVTGTSAAVGVLRLRRAR